MSPRSPRLASPRLASPRLASPRLASPRLASPRRLAAIAFAVASIWVACNPPPLDVGPDLIVGGSSPTPFAAGTEVSAAFVYPFTLLTPAGPIFEPSRTIYQYNPGGGQGFAWSWLDTTGWHNCNATSTCFVPLAPNQRRWIGDPRIISGSPDWQDASSGKSFAGVVVASSLGVSTSGKRDQVILAISTDGGTTFNQGIQVNDGGCPGGKVDQQDIAFDPTENSIWVVWRYAGAIILPTYGACIRGGTISLPASGPPTIQWATSSQQIHGYNHEPFYGIGGLIVQPANLAGGVTVVYNNTDNFHEDCPATTDMYWFSITTQDYGATWLPTHEILHSSQFAPCTPGNRYNRVTRGTFAFVRDANNVLWAAVNDTQNSAQIFSSNDEGNHWNYDATAFLTGLFHPTFAADQSGRVALFFYGATGDLTGSGDLGSQMTPFIMERELNPPLWTIPYGAGNSFASVTLPSGCSSDSQCPCLFNCPGNGRCKNGQCVGSRGLGDYQGMAFVPAQPSGNATEAWNPAWSVQASPSQIHTSFVNVEQ